MSRLFQTETSWLRFALDHAALSFQSFDFAVGQGDGTLTLSDPTGFQIRQMNGYRRRSLVDRTLQIKALAMLITNADKIMSGFSHSARHSFCLKLARMSSDYLSLLPRVVFPHLTGKIPRAVSKGNLIRCLS